MKFRTQYERIRFINDSGSPFKEVWELSPNAINEFDIQLSKKKLNLQEYINSFKDSLDVPHLVERFKNGDITALGDISSMSSGSFIGIPDNPQELYRRVKIAEEYFDGLPKELKDQFKSAEDYFSSVGTERFSQIIGAYNEKYNKETIAEMSAEAE